MTPRITRTLTGKNGPHHFISFSNGVTGECWQNGPDWIWILHTPNGSDAATPCNRAWDADNAFRGMTVAAYAVGGFEFAPMDYTADTARAFENGSCVAFTKELRRVLKARTGRAWSARVGTGTGYNWIRVCAPPARLVRHSQTAEDSAMLGAAIGEFHRDGHSIPPTKGYRAAILLRAATGDGSAIECGSHNWD